jgi:hypothetical protein
VSFFFFFFLFFSHQYKYKQQAATVKVHIPLVALNTKVQVQSARAYTDTDTGTLTLTLKLASCKLSHRLLDSFQAEELFVVNELIDLKAQPQSLGRLSNHLLQLLLQPGLILQARHDQERIHLLEHGVS